MSKIAPSTTSPRDPHAVQTAWLKAHIGKAIKVRLLDGKALTGELVAYDTFTLLVRTDAGRELLVYKQALAFLAPHSETGGGEA